VSYFSRPTGVASSSWSWLQAAAARFRRVPCRGWLSLRRGFSERVFLVSVFYCLCFLSFLYLLQQLFISVVFPLLLFCVFLISSSSDLLACFCSLFMSCCCSLSSLVLFAMVVIHSRPVLWCSAMPVIDVLPSLVILWLLIVSSMCWTALSLSSHALSLCLSSGLSNGNPSSVSVLVLCFILAYSSHCSFVHAFLILFSQMALALAHGSYVHWAIVCVSSSFLFLFLVHVLLLLFEFSGFVCNGGYPFLSCPLGQCDACHRCSSQSCHPVVVDHEEPVFNCLVSFVPCLFALS
jgi:hypothetical protein